MNELESITSQLAAMGKRTTTFRYPAELKEQIIAHVKQRRAKGEGHRCIASSLTIPWLTLERWLQEPDVPGQSLVPVHVIDEEVQPLIPRLSMLSLSIVTPRGYRLEGLDLEQAYSLLGRLG